MIGVVDLKRRPYVSQRINVYSGWTEALFMPQMSDANHLPPKVAIASATMPDAGLVHRQISI